MEFKIGDKVNIHPDSAYLLQGMKDGRYITGLVISKEEYKNYDYDYTLDSKWSKHKDANDYNVHVIWGESNSYHLNSNSYRTKDLVLDVKEHRDKLLNEILDGI
jgi:hypothetical protein